QLTTTVCLYLSTTCKFQHRDCYFTVDMFPPPGAAKGLYGLMLSQPDLVSARWVSCRSDRLHGPPCRIVRGRTQSPYDDARRRLLGLPGRTQRIPIWRVGRCLHHNTMTTCG